MRIFDSIRNKFNSIFNPSPQPRDRRQISARVNYFDSGFTYGSGSKFPAGTSRGTPIDIHDHFSLRQRIRNQLYDSVEARALVTSIVDTTVDVGLQLKPTPIPEILGRTPEELETWAAKTAMMFNLWAEDKKSHRSRINNFYQNQRLYQLFQQRDNDIFTRLLYGRDKDILNPVQIEFLDPNQIRGYDYTTTYMQLPGYDGYGDGIVRDSANREIAYKIWKLEKDGKYKPVEVPAIGEKSKRIFMLHGYNPEYAGQGRGYSKMSHLIQELENLTDFKFSTIQKAINQASMIAAVENEEQDASNPLEGRVAGPIKEYGSYSQLESDQPSTTDIFEEPGINWDVTHEATIRQPGSLLIGNLRRGDKLKYLQDTSPSAQYNTFIESFFACIAASMGWSIELVLKKFNQNYSASRGTLLLCWRTAQIERNEMIADFCNPVYEMWLSEEIASGRIQCPGWSDKYMRAAWLSCEWAGAPLPNIDPLKTAEADQKYAELGAQTLDDIARNFNGSSGKANRAKNARQFEELPTPPWSAVPVQQNPDDEEKGEDE